jgi:RimJ/RimL family protein N-acetyltransferase
MALYLRPYLTEEFESACAIRELSDPAAIDRFRLSFQKSGEWNDHYLHLAIADSISNTLIGDIQLRHCKQMMPPGTAHIGLEIAANQRGKGLGSDALSLIPAWADKNGFHRIEGATDESNIAMRRTFEKAGWNFEGALKNLFMVDGQGHDYLSFAWTRA